MVPRKVHELWSSVTRLLAVAALLLVPTSEAHAVVYDFESEPTGTGLSSVTMTQGAASITIYRGAAGPLLTVQDITLVGGTPPPSFGSRSLWTADTLSGPYFSVPTVFNFGAPTNRFALDFGDFFADNDTPVVMTAWSAAGGVGVIAGSVFTTWLATDGFPSFKTLTIYNPITPFLSVTFSSGGTTFVNSMYVDNLSFPEPTTVLLLGAGLGALALLRRRRSA